MHNFEVMGAYRDVCICMYIYIYIDIYMSGHRRTHKVIGAFRAVLKVQGFRVWGSDGSVQCGVWGSEFRAEGSRSFCGLRFQV